MNVLDVLVIVLVAYCAYRGSKKGITVTVASIVLKIISLFLSIRFYAKLTAYIRQTAFFQQLQEKMMGTVMETLLMNPQTAASEGGSLLQQFLLYASANDNPEVHQLFHSTSQSEYIAAYLANIAVNIISIFLLYTFVYFVFRTMGKILIGGTRMVSSLPLIHQIDQIGGVLGGCVQAVVILWFLVIGLTLLLMLGVGQNVYDMLENSKIASYFLIYNPLADAIFKVLA